MNVHKYLLHMCRHHSDGHERLFYSYLDLKILDERVSHLAGVLGVRSVLLLNAQFFSQLCRVNHRVARPLLASSCFT